MIGPCCNRCGSETVNGELCSRCLLAIASPKPEQPVTEPNIGHSLFGTGVVFPRQWAERAIHAWFEINKIPGDRRWIHYTWLDGEPVTIWYFNTPAR